MWGKRVVSGWGGIPDSEIANFLQSGYRSLRVQSGNEETLRKKVRKG